MAELRDRPIDDVLAPALDEAETAQVWRRIRDVQAERRVAPRRWRYAVATGLALAAAAILLVAWPARGPRPGPLGGEVALAPGAQLGAAAPRAVGLDDGSRVTLDADARLEVLANEGDKFVTAVRRGRVGFEVRPGGPRRWVIETDLATIEVVGTAFAIDRSATGLDVTVARGVVLVRGERVPGRVVRLTAGQRIAVALTPSTITAAAAASSPPIEPATATATAPLAPAPPIAATSIPPASPIAATSIPPASPIAATPRAPVVVAPAVPAAVDGAAIIARADDLVAAGRHEAAAAALAAYLADAPDDATAGLAAFLLGRLAQDELAQPARATVAFARVLAIGSPRVIQEEALARQARAFAASGRTDDAAAAARRYLARYPSGPRADAMSALATP